MEECTTEEHSHRLKDAKELKRSRDNVASEKDLLPTTTDTYREQLGEVRRRNDKQVRAQPPPPPPPSSNKRIESNTSRGRKKQTTGCGSDSESNSDREDSRRNPGEGGTDVSSRKKKEKEPSTSDHIQANSKHTQKSPSAVFSLSPEEEARVRMQRAVFRQKQTDEGGFRHLLDWRLINIRELGYHKERMLSILRMDPINSPLLSDKHNVPWVWRIPNRNVIMLQELWTRQFLNEALCLDIEDRDDQAFNGAISSKTSNDERLLRDLIVEAESVFVAWWSQFFPVNRRTLKDVLNDWQGIEHINTKDTKIPKPLSDFIRNGNIWDLLGKDLGYDSFAGIYGSRILTEMIRSHSHTEEDDFAHIRYWVRDHENFDALLPSSRRDGVLFHDSKGLNQNYVDWVRCKIPSDRIQAFCLQRSQQMRGAEIRVMLHGSSTRQEFCSDTNNENMSLILFKGGMPCSIRTLDFRCKQRLGWYTDRSSYYEIPYRYKLDPDLGYHFRVDINNKLRGIHLPHTDILYSYSDDSRHTTLFCTRTTADDDS